MTDHVDGCKALVTKDVADCDCVSMLRAEIERLTALAQVMGEERDKAWTEHLIERENLKAEINRLLHERHTTRKMLQDLLEKHGQHYGVGRGGLRVLRPEER